MEKELNELVRASLEPNRTKWVCEWKNQGKKVVGTLCTYVPEEVIYAAGVLPLRVIPSTRANVDLALAYRPAPCCPFCKHVLASVLSGELDFLDGVIGTNRDGDLVRLLDVWGSLEKTPFVYYMSLPHRHGELARQQFVKEIGRLIKSLEDFAEVKISQTSLQGAIRVLNHSRRLLSQLYELRKREVPPLSGSEVLGITCAAMVMPKEEFNDKLEALLPYLDTRKAPLQSLRPRLLVSGDLLDRPDYLRLIEEAGCIVSMDDFDTGSRYFWQYVDSSENPIYALAERYLERPASPHMCSWPKQALQVIQWVKEFHIDGVLELRLADSRAREFYSPFLLQRLQDAGIRSMSLVPDYGLANAAQLRTRIQAFVEMLGIG